MNLSISVVIALFLGALTWSFSEYCIHRWLGHRFTKNFFGKEHVAHHSKGNYFASSWKKLTAAVTPDAKLSSVDSATSVAEEFVDVGLRSRFPARSVM